jgi:hypothetical protein
MHVRRWTGISCGTDLIHIIRDSNNTTIVLFYSMRTDNDLLRLDESLNQLATLYQFRSPDEPTYGSLTVSQS